MSESTTLHYDSPASPLPLKSLPRASRSDAITSDVLVLSHLRWNFVFQRPQHLLTRCARTCRVFFFEEPVFEEGTVPKLARAQDKSGVIVVTPHLPAGLEGESIEILQRKLVDLLIREEKISQYVLWYYSPMARGFTRHLVPDLTVYDCMDELSAFKFAPQNLKEREAELLRVADLVFTGGQSLYEAKRRFHPRVFPFPSSVDVTHFAQARHSATEPEDQARIPGPKLGFFGVIDERMNLDLLREMAERRPEWQLIMVGPVVKIDPETLPRLPNIHYLGSKAYADLPRYLAGWDVALMPFALNESTRFISPTKTPEYLAAGRPVVSTPIHDVVRPYGEESLVYIANTAEEFIAATEKLLAGLHPRSDWSSAVESFLGKMSWERTWQRMATLMRTFSPARENEMSDRNTVTPKPLSRDRQAGARTAGP